MRDQTAPTTAQRRRHETPTWQPCVEEVGGAWSNLQLLFLLWARLSSRLRKTVCSEVLGAALCTRLRTWHALSFAS
jgi:hypothetical protein